MSIDLAAERLAALLDAERENTALRAEVERLRGEVSYLRACVPPTRPTDYGHEVWAAARHEAVAEERAAVVAWLRAKAEGMPDLWAVTATAYHLAANTFEDGEHRREEGA